MPNAAFAKLIVPFADSFEIEKYWIKRSNYPLLQKFESSGANVNAESTMNSSQMPFGRHGYSPDKHEAAVSKVLQQSKLVPHFLTEQCS